MAGRARISLVAAAVLGAIAVIVIAALFRGEFAGGGFFLRTTLWAAAVALGASFAGWWPGRLLASLLDRGGFVFTAALCLVPICLPAYLMYWCWWQAWPQGSALHEWAVAHELIGLVRGATLYLALVFWSWPIAAWCVAGSLARAGRSTQEMHALDGAPRRVRAWSMLRQSAPGLAAGFIIILLFTFNETTAFDLATVRTLGYELRAAARTGAGAGEVVVMAWPGLLIAAACLAALGAAFSARAERPEARPPRFSGAALSGAILLWVCSLGVPASLLVFGQQFAFADFGVVAEAYARAAANTFLTACAAGAIAAVAAVLFAAAWSGRRRTVRRAAMVLGAAAVFLAVIPAPVIAVLIESLLNTPLLSEVAYQTFAAILCGYLARFGFVAVLLGVWIAARESREERQMREVDGAVSLTARVRAGRPRWLAGSAAAFMIVTVLSMSEVVVTAHVQPPGFDAAAAILLNNMHYQRDAMVVLMAMILFACAFLAAGVAASAMILGSARRRS